MFTIKRDSWHYKLNMYFMDDWRTWMIEDWEARGFCAYWWSTVWKLLIVAVVSFILGALLAVLLIILLTEPLLFLVILAFMTIPVVLTFLFMWFTEYLDRPRADKGEPTSLFAQKYKAYKDKVCPAVKFED